MKTSRSRRGVASRTARTARAAVWAACIVLAACGSEPISSPPPATGAAANVRLADTRWRLVEFQSMDDAIGTRRPDDRTRYTLQLHGDGTVAMQLDCNRATGRWTSQPSADGASGRLAFGPLAVTRALCPPPSLGEGLSAQMPYVRGYLLKDGRLNLSLMADGGILVWEPAGR